jgi:1,4-dihydroxy-2-naphthoate octaprenyltransferase
MMPPSLALAAVRPGFLTASLLPVLAGTAWGTRAAGEADPLAAALALVATALVHSASNVYNDVSDDLLGTDRANTTRIAPYTGGSRLIQDGRATVAEMRLLAGLLGLLGIGAGALLALRAGPAVLLWGAAGAALGIAYSRPGIRLSGRGLGEAAIAAAFGVLPVTGAWWLQAGTVTTTAVLASLPVSAWSAAIILANEMPDAPSDAATGKRTLAVRCGPRTPLLHGGAQAGASLACIALAGTAGLPAWTLAGPALLLVAGVVAARSLAGGRADLERGIRLTLAVHAAGTLWLVGAALA